MVTGKNWGSRVVDCVRILFWLSYFGSCVWFSVVLLGQSKEAGTEMYPNPAGLHLFVSGCYKPTYKVYDLRLEGLWIESELSCSSYVSLDKCNNGLPLFIIILSYNVLCYYTALLNYTWFMNEYFLLFLLELPQISTAVINIAEEVQVTKAWNMFQTSSLQLWHWHLHVFTRLLSHNLQKIGQCTVQLNVYDVVVLPVEVTTFCIK